MRDLDNQVFTGPVNNGQQALELVARLFRIAEPGAVYGPPVVSGDRTVVMASEVTISMGAGHGSSSEANPAMDNRDDRDNNGTGALVESSVGGGGGGFAFGRPVAAVIIEPGGVRVEPVVDVTKLGIALFTTLGAIFLAWFRMRRTSGKG